jgi:hypothetical protein
VFSKRACPGDLYCGSIHRIGISSLGDEKPSFLFPGILVVTDCIDNPRIFAVGIDTGFGESKKLTNDFCKEGSNSTPRSAKGSFKGTFDLCVSPKWFMFRLFKEVYGRSFR